MRRFIRTIRLAAASVVAFSTLLTVGFTGVVHALPGSYCQWTGTANGTWDDNGNWTATSSGCTGTSSVATGSVPNSVPGAGDNVVFDNSVLTSGDVTATNGAALSLTSLWFQGSGSNDFTVAGSALTVTGGLTQAGTNLPLVTAPLVISGNQTFSVANEVSLAGALSGSGNITMAGAGILDLVSSPSYTGTLTDGTGIVSLTNTTGTFAFGSIVITNGGSLDLDNLASGNGTFNFALSLGGNGSGSVKALNVSQTASNTSILAGATTLTSNVLVDGAGTLNITGALSGAFTIGVDTGQSLTLNINSSNNTSNTPNTATAGDTTSGDGGSAPDTPDTGFAFAAAHPLVTLAVTLASAATIFAIARTTRKSTARR